MAGANRPKGAPRARRRNGGLAVLLPLALLAISLFIAVIVYVGTTRVYDRVVTDLPDPRDLDSIVLGENSGVFDRTGAIKLADFGTDLRETIDFDQIPSIVIDTTTVIEDKTYWQNSGFDPLGFIAAALDTLGGSGRGGSTITQQLVRALLLPDAAFQGSIYERKVKEIIQAIRLTREFPGRVGKEQIITAYMNNNYYGSRAYGIRAAATEYFGISDLTLLTTGQAALLAAIPQAPSDFDLRLAAVRGEDGLLRVPLDSPVAQRRTTVLNLLRNAKNDGIALETTDLTDEEIDAAATESITLVEPPLSKVRAPHFINIVREAAAGIICPDDPDVCTKLDTQGYKITTTLDWTMQQSADKWAAAVLSADIVDYKPYLRSLGIEKPTDWLKKIRGSNIHNAAIATMDARTGDILAYTGSADYYADSTSPQFQPQFDVLKAYRQPGSAIKPIIYAYALQRRAITPATLLMDAPVDFGSGWTPGEWDNLERGPVRMRLALQGSLNIPAIKTAIRTGADRIWSDMRNGVFKFLGDDNYAGASIAIGTLESRYIDMLSAYSALANEGDAVPRRYILQIQDRNGEPIWSAASPASERRSVMEPAVANLVTNIIAGNTDPSQNPVWADRRLTAENGKRRPATLKTGTTDQAKDLAAFGYLAPPSDSNAPHLVTGVWTGNSDASPATVLSLSAAGGLWQSYFSEISRDLPIAQFGEPIGLDKVIIDAHTGELPGACTSKTVREYFLPGTAPTTSCSSYRTLAIDEATGLLWDSACVGPEIAKEFMDLSLLESDWPTWQAANIEWAERARQGNNVKGGAKGGRTSYFYASYWRPLGNSWGGEIAPTKSCLSVPPAPVDPLGDADSDGVANGIDNCPLVANPDQSDIDVDGVGDLCEPPAPVLP